MNDESPAPLPEPEAEMNAPQPEPAVAARTGAELREQGAARLREGNFAEAADLLGAAVREDARDADGWRLLGGALSSLADNDGAVAAFTEAARLAPESARSHYNLGLALHRSGRTVEARHRFEQALLLDPSHPAARDRLAEIAAAEGVSSSPSLPPMAAPLPQEPTEGASSNRWGESPAGVGAGVGGQRQLPRPGVSGNAAVDLQSGTILALGIVGLAGGLSCGLPLLASPLAWSMGNAALEKMKTMDAVDPTVRSQIQTGRTLGIAGTVILILAVLAVLALILVGVTLPDRF